MRGNSVYPQIMIQMLLRGWDYRELAEKAGLSYTSLRRKLLGKTPLYLDDARCLQKAFDCGMSLDELFVRRMSW